MFTCRVVADVVKTLSDRSTNTRPHSRTTGSTRCAETKDSTIRGWVQIAVRDLTLAPSSLQLYELIFQRTLASVMVDAELDLTTVLVLGKGGGEEGLFRSSGKVVVNPGWMRAYQVRFV
jgi:DNA topoisomerase-1